MIDPLDFPTPENLIERLSARHSATQYSVLGKSVSIFGEAVDRIQYLEDRNEEIMTRWGHSQTCWVKQIKKLRAQIERVRDAAKAMEDGQFRSELECAEMIHQALKEIE